MNMSLRRLQAELVALNRDTESSVNVSAEPASEENLYKWTGTIIGPKDTPYEGGTFILDIDIPKSYPFSPPKIKFRTKVYHCNVGFGGFICLDVLRGDIWSPAMTIISALLSISSLLSDPNPYHETDDAMIATATEAYLNRRADHDRVAKEWTQTYAMPPKE